MLLKLLYCTYSLQYMQSWHANAVILWALERWYEQSICTVRWGWWRQLQAATSRMLTTTCGTLIREPPRKSAWNIQRNTLLEQWYPTQYVHLTLHPKGGQQAGTVKAGSFTVRVSVCVERVGWSQCWGLDGEQRYGLHCSKRWERRFVCTQKFFARWRTNLTRPSRSRFFVNLKQTCIKWLEASNLLVGWWSLKFPSASRSSWFLCAGSLVVGSQVTFTAEYAPGLNIACVDPRTWVWLGRTHWGLVTSPLIWLL